MRWHICAQVREGWLTMSCCDILWWWWCPVLSTIISDLFQLAQLATLLRTTDSFIYLIALKISWCFIVVSLPATVLVRAMNVNYIIKLRSKLKLNFRRRIFHAYDCNKDTQKWYDEMSKWIRAHEHTLRVCADEFVSIAVGTTIYSLYCARKCWGKEKQSEKPTEHMQ